MRSSFSSTPVSTLTLEMTTQEVAAFMAYATSTSESEQWSAGAVLQRQIVYAKDDLTDLKGPLELKVLIVPKPIKNSPK